MPTADSSPSDPALTSSPRRSVNVRRIATVTVTPRDVARPLEVVGRTPLEEFQTMEQWIVGKYAYVTSIVAGRLWVFDISNPAAPVKVDSVDLRCARAERHQHDRRWQGRGRHPRGRLESQERDRVSRHVRSRTPEDPVGVHRNGLGRRAQRVHRRPSRVPDR